MLAERVLAHSPDNKVEAAYQRGDMFEKLQRLMGDPNNDEDEE
jgi:hypothetical protein